MVGPDVEKFHSQLSSTLLNRSSPKSYHLHLECSRKLMLCSSYRGTSGHYYLWKMLQLSLLTKHPEYLDHYRSHYRSWIIIFISSRISSIVTFRGFPLRSPSVLFFIQFLLSMRLLSALRRQSWKAGRKYLALHYSDLGQCWHNHVRSRCHCLYCGPHFHSLSYTYSSLLSSEFCGCRCPRLRFVSHLHPCMGQLC